MGNGFAGRDPTIPFDRIYTINQMPRFGGFYLNPVSHVDNSWYQLMKLVNAN